MQTGTNIMFLTPETNIMRQGQAFIKQFFVNCSGKCVRHFFAISYPLSLMIRAHDVACAFLSYTFPFGSPRLLPSHARNSVRRKKAIEVIRMILFVLHCMISGCGEIEDKKNFYCHIDRQIQNNRWWKKSVQLLNSERRVNSILLSPLYDWNIADTAWNTINQSI